MKKCVFSGTFDPPTAGHKSVIEKCLALFDEVVVAVMVNPDKRPLLSEEERKTLLEKLFCGEPRVRVTVFCGAAVDLLEREDTPFYVRGVRGCLDLDFENSNYYANKKLKNDIITLYIPAEQETSHVSSTLVRNSVRLSKAYAGYVPAEIEQDFLKMLEAKDV